MSIPSILIVDDEESIRLTLEFQLRKQGYIIKLASSGEQAISLLNKTTTYNIVITDLMMSGKNGLDIFNLILKEQLNIPVVLMSGFGIETSIYKEAIKLKPQGFLIKPFAEDDLLKVINHCLDN
jgi:DNA-binding NtrC family response regulator